MSSNTGAVCRYYDGNAADENNSSLEKRKESKIYYLRNFNNWTKSVFINNFLDPLRCKGIRVFDLCCGKGGDQLKWLFNSISHVTFVDISKQSISVCKERYEKLRLRRKNCYTAKFFVADCFQDDLVKLTNSNVLYHLVSCQFAVHYAFETLSQAQKLLSNISELLEDGGYFIATIPNAYELVRRAQAVFSERKKDNTLETEGIMFGNSVYSIHFPKTSFEIISTKDEKSYLQFHLFAAQYFFRLEGVVDCPEYLVYPPLLDELASKYGLFPVQQFKTFPENVYNALNVNSNYDKKLLQRMQALESCNIQNASGENYSHVRNRVKEDNLQFGYVNTLSMDNWEVASIYSMVAYQKRSNN